MVLSTLLNVFFFLLKTKEIGQNLKDFGISRLYKSIITNLEKKYTVRYFLDITKNSYGRDVIKMLRKAYKILK